MAKDDPNVERHRKNKNFSTSRYVKLVFKPDSYCETMNANIAMMANSKTIAKTEDWKGFVRIKEV